MPLNLELTMLSGQTPNFIWNHSNGVFARAWKGKIIEMQQDKQSGKLKTSNKKFSDFTLRLQDNLQSVQKKIAKDKFMKKAVGNYAGLRVTQSDLWETIACFVLSSNRSIPIIRMNVQELMRNYGEKVEGLFEFPQPEDLGKCTEQAFRKSKCGFRAKYLLGTTRLVLERGDLDFKTSAELKELLLRCPGIGEKIADCVLLYGFGDLTAFPIDVWVKRGMEKVYFKGKEQKSDAIIKKASDLWNGLQGYAQLYLYYEFLKGSSGNTGKQV